MSSAWEERFVKICKVICETMLSFLDRYKGSAHKYSELCGGLNRLKDFQMIGHVQLLIR